MVTPSVRPNTVVLTRGMDRRLSMAVAVGAAGVALAWRLWLLLGKLLLLHFALPDLLLALLL